MNSRDLQMFIDAHQIAATILPLEEHTPTVTDAARALNVQREQIIKSLVFMAAGEPLLVINNGPARIDRKKLAAYLSVGRKKVKFASPEKALDITGYVVGSMPPFGHKQKLRTLVDEGVGRLDDVYGGGGDINAMMRLKARTLIQVSRAEIAALSE